MTVKLRVDIPAVARLAERIRRAAGEARAASTDPGPLHAAVAALGTPCLVQATAAFVDNWRGVLADLVHDAERLADLVELAARSYQDVESAAARLIPAGTAGTAAGTAAGTDTGPATRR